MILTCDMLLSCQENTQPQECLKSCTIWKGIFAPLAGVDAGYVNDLLRKGPTTRSEGNLLEGLVK